VICGPSLLKSFLSMFFRLPRIFLVSLILFIAIWTFVIFNFLDAHVNLPSVQFLKSLPIVSYVADLIVAVVLVVIYIVGLFVAYNAAVFVNRRFAKLQRVRFPAVQPFRPDPICAKTEQIGGPGVVRVDNNPLHDVHRIGIVLAGGGAKGAFQAGAMKAIYQFLAKNDALDKVRVISGTSIGAWNALFWLGDLIESRDTREKSAHERWWSTINLRSLVSPYYYVLGRHNSFLVTEPWQQCFDAIFDNQAEIKDRIANSKIHFYFTRSRVESGHLECASNYEGASAIGDIPKIDFAYLDPAGERFMEQLKFSVFASMDLPPLFPYMATEGDYFEDGGVIDNLPILFATMEQESCDLVFVLPLNSDFNADPNRRSLLNRIIRVMDVRQGALERASLKNHYLYNELAVLRKRVEALEQELRKANIQVPPPGSSDTLQRALNRKHGLSKVFAICPLRTYVESTINTQELWKANQAGRVFRRMHEATTKVLRKFDLTQEKIRVALVDNVGQHSWHEDF
jgi:NTE family protein